VSERQHTKISADLLEELRERAKEQGRTETEVLEEAVRKYLERSGSLTEMLDRVATRQRELGVRLLSEDEAMSLAVEEQHSWRQERRGRAG
jgi:hypothetical protein